MFSFRSMLVLVAIFAAPNSGAQELPPSGWKTQTNSEFGFRMSYPADWAIFDTKVPDVRFWVSAPGAHARCTVRVVHDAELTKVSSAKVNSVLQQLPMEKGDWAEYSGINASHFTLLASRRTVVSNVPALGATLETDIQNIAGKYLRKQLIAFTMTSPPGLVWLIGCDSMHQNPAEARAIFGQMEPTFRRAMDSFRFVKK